MAKRGINNRVRNGYQTVSINVLEPTLIKDRLQVSDDVSMIIGSIKNGDSFINIGKNYQYGYNCDTDSLNYPAKTKD